MLEGIRVVSFSHFVQGPAASQYLADMGADVIKVEPVTGAFERNWSGGNAYVNGTSASFLAVNRNKRSFAVDLKHPKAREILYPIIATADVVMENYRSGVLDKLGFGYEALRAVKPDLIYASASGWGSSGPMATQAGQDLLVQAHAGLVAATGNPATSPAVPGVPIVDQHGAALLAMGVLSAYIHRQKTGEGTRVESNLLNAAIDLQSESFSVFTAHRERKASMARDGRLASWYLGAPYGVYQLKDCQAVISNGGDLSGLADALELPALKALDLDADRDSCAQLLGDALRNWTFERLHQALGPRGYWYARVNSYEDVLQDPQVRHNGIFQEIPVGEDKAVVACHPVRYNGAAPALRTVPLALGDATRALLQEAGLDPAQIAELVQAGVVKAP